MISCGRWVWWRTRGRLYTQWEYIPLALRFHKQEFTVSLRRSAMPVAGRAPSWLASLKQPLLTSHSLHAGSPVIAELVMTARPRYHIAAGKPTFFARPPYLNADLGAGAHVTRFIGLAQVSGGGGCGSWRRVLGIRPARGVKRRFGRTFFPGSHCPCLPRSRPGRQWGQAEVAARPGLDPRSGDDPGDPPGATPRVDGEPFPGSCGQAPEEGRGGCGARHRPRVPGLEVAGAEEGAADHGSTQSRRVGVAACKRTALLLEPAQGSGMRCRGDGEVGAAEICMCEIARGSAGPATHHFPHAVRPNYPTSHMKALLLAEPLYLFNHTQVGPTSSKTSTRRYL